MGNSSMTTYTRIHNGEKVVFSINSAGNTGRLHRQELKWATFLHHIQNQIHNRLKT